MSRPVKEINAEFLAEDRYLDSLRQIAREACVAAEMPRKTTTAVLLAIEEGATNVIRHAYLYEKGTIRLRIVIYKKLVAFSLIDNGRSFQPSGNAKLNLEKLVESGRRGGLGFYMIQKIMDSVEYLSSAGYNELRMIKRLSPASEQSPPLLRRMNTLRAKFSIYTFLIVSLIIFGAYYYVNNLTTRGLYDRLDSTVSALGATIGDQAAGYVLNQRSDVEFDELIVSYIRSNPELKQIVLTDANGFVTAHSEDTRNIRQLYVPPARITPSAIGRPQRLGEGEEADNYLMLPIRSGGQQLGWVHIVYSSSGMKERLADARTKIIALIGLLLAIGVVGIYLLSIYFVKPIVKISQRVRRFSLGDMTTELPLEGADEFFEISSALNDMMTRISRDRKSMIEQEKMAKEIELTSQIQKTLMPTTLPAIAGFEIDAYYRAAAVVGGDLYDIFEISPGRFCVTVADVSGKGLPASLVMSMLRTVIRIYADKSESPRTTLIAVNDYIIRNLPANMFITVMLGIYDSMDSTFTFVSAGHNPLIVYSGATGEIRQLNPPGMPLGIPVALHQDFADRLTEEKIQLHSGDIFFAYTDGITEATNRETEQFGVKRILSLMRETFGENGRPEELPENNHENNIAKTPSTLSAFSQSLIEQIDTFSGFAKQGDDITFVIGRVLADTVLVSSNSQMTLDELETREISQLDSDTSS